MTKIKIMVMKCNYATLDYGKFEDLASFILGSQQVCTHVTVLTNTIPVVLGTKDDP